MGGPDRNRDSREAVEDAKDNPFESLDFTHCLSDSRISAVDWHCFS